MSNSLFGVSLDAAGIFVKKFACFVNDEVKEKTMLFLVCSTVGLVVWWKGSSYSGKTKKNTKNDARTHKREAGWRRYLQMYPMKHFVKIYKRKEFSNEGINLKTYSNSSSTSLENERMSLGFRAAFASPTVNDSCAIIQRCVSASTITSYYMEKPTLEKALQTIEAFREILSYSEKASSFYRDEVEKQRKQLYLVQQQINAESQLRQEAENSVSWLQRELDKQKANEQIRLEAEVKSRQTIEQKARWLEDQLGFLQKSFEGKNVHDTIFGKDLDVSSQLFETLKKYQQELSEERCKTAEADFLAKQYQHELNNLKLSFYNTKLRLEVELREMYKQQEQMFQYIADNHSCTLSTMVEEHHPHLNGWLDSPQSTSLNQDTLTNSSAEPFFGLDHNTTDPSVAWATNAKFAIPFPIPIPYSPDSSLHFR